MRGQLPRVSLALNPGYEVWNDPRFPDGVGIRFELRRGEFSSESGVSDTAMSTARLEPYQVEAYNTARESENKIHDDDVARRFGFGGALVPGVDVYAYMTHLPLRRWGRAWLTRGSAECRFMKPVYDGEIATVTASETADGLAIEVTSRGELCATGAASLPAAPPAAPAIDGLRRVSPPTERPPADEATLAPGTPLGIRPLIVTPDYAAQYLHDLRETDPIYAVERLGHPGMILRGMNWALTHNVVLGPWIHVGSKVQHFSMIAIGEELSVAARVSANYERKGHRFVELDGMALANGTRPIAHIVHTAIYQPRQAAAA
jgi:acyl dehydratase